jgi:hypothetical protein
MSNNSENALKQPVQELVDSEGSFIDGDRNVTSDSEIETGPVQKPFNDTSDYEKGMSTTSDRASRYRQNIPWFAVYSYGANTGLKKDVYESKKVITKGQLEEQIKEDLVKKSKNREDIIDKNSGKVKEVINLITDTDLDIEQIEKLVKLINKMKEKSNVSSADISSIKKALENKQNKNA